MAKRKRHKSTLTRAERIKAITAMRYEPGNQAKCYKAVWRHWIEPEFGICYLTYLRYLGIPPTRTERRGTTPSPHCLMTIDRQPPER